ncbi:MAG: Cna B-type domain-containing protein, partial [Parvimonas sp.]|uniref:SpaA isopeptide-forming pilin-related protein n=1 Tax=Parvimonas sp. TaxID=1944660 RepID=UPI0025D86292
LKYNGPLDSNGKVIDAGEGTYSEPINVGSLRVPGEFNSFWDANNRDTSIEGMTYAFGQIWFTSVVKDRATGNITKRLARIVSSQPDRGKLPNRNTDSTVKFEAQKLDGDNGIKIQNLPTSTFADMTGGDREICSPEVIVRGAKTWIGDDESIRPKSIEVQLYANGSPYNYSNGNSSKLTLNKENNWKYQFAQLPKYDSNNQKINYTVKEINPPSNYLMTSTDYSITNTLIKGGFSVKKTNEDKSKALGGAKFLLLNETKDKIVSSSVETDNNGVVNFSGLTAGIYYLKEEVAPEFYQKDNVEYKVVGTINQNTKKIDFEIFKNSSKVETENDNHIIKNTKPKYKLKLVKIDSKTGQKITNLTTRFAIVDSNGNTINGQVSSFNGEFIFDNRGQKFEAGTYYLKEETAPNGYKIINKLIPITISNDGKVFLNTADNNKVDAYGVNVTGNDTIEIKVKNDKDNVRFVFSKRIKGIENTGRHITTETEFKLTKDEDNTFVPKVVKQNADRNFVFENLAEGVYTLEETKTPDGYVLDTVSYKVVVDSVGKVSLYSKSSTEKIKNITDKDFIKSSDLTNITSGADTDAVDENANTAVIFSNFNNQGNDLPAGSYVGVDLKVLYDISKIKFLQGAPSNPADRYNKFSLEYSLDGINWKNLKNYEETDTTKGVSSPVNNIEEANLNVNARYIRFKNNEIRQDVWFGVREIQVEGAKYNLIKTITPQMQLSETENNIAFIGNIQNPQISLEKIDAITENIITQNNQNKDYNAKFKLFKVDDKKESITEEEISNLTSIQEFTLNQGKTETVQLANKLGRYVLVETESPNGYEKVSSILLDLVETQQVHSGTQNKNTTSWKVVENTTGGIIGESGDYTTFSGVAKNDKVVVDYTNLSQNKITLKVKNTQSSKKVKIKVRKVNENKELITGTQDVNVARFSILGSNKEIVNGQIATMYQGEFIFDNKGEKFESGLYYLKEERAPKEYVLINKEIPFYIKDTGEIIIPAKLKAGSVNEYEVDEEFSYKNQIKIEKSTDVDTIIINVENKKVKYPTTGGSGVLRYVLIGSTLMGITALVIIKRRRYLK